MSFPAAPEERRQRPGSYRSSAMLTHPPFRLSFPSPTSQSNNTPRTQYQSYAITLVKPSFKHSHFNAPLFFYFRGGRQSTNRTRNPSARSRIHPCRNTERDKKVFTTSRYGSPQAVVVVDVGRSDVNEYGKANAAQRSLRASQRSPFYLPLSSLSPLEHTCCR